MPKTSIQKATLLIEMSEHGIDYTLSGDVELDILIVDYETEHYEDEDTAQFDGCDAFITYTIPNRNSERVTAAERANSTKSKNRVTRP